MAMPGTTRLLLALFAAHAVSSSGCRSDRVPAPLASPEAKTSSSTSAPRSTAVVGRRLQVRSDDAEVCVVQTDRIACTGTGDPSFAQSGLARTRGVSDLSAWVDGQRCGVWGGGRVRCHVASADGPGVDHDVSTLVDAVRVEPIRGDEACALRRDGTLACWRGREAPRMFAGPGIVVDVFGMTDENELCVIEASGRLFCTKWVPVLGDPEGTVEWSDPFADVERAACIRWDDDHVECLLHANGEQYTSDGGRRLMSAPSRVVGSADVPLARAPGRGYRCDLTTDSGVVCTGSNAPTVLGSADARASRVALPQLKDVQELRVGTQLACALQRDGGVHCWGNNERGAIVPSGSVAAPKWLAVPTAVTFDR